MSAVAVALITFALILSSVAVGLVLRRWLPEQHLSGDSKDVIKLATALIATMSALVIALLFASTRTSYEFTGGQVSRLTAGVIELDRLLKGFGPDGVVLRQTLRKDVAVMADSIWHEEAASSYAQGPAPMQEAEVMTQLRQLAPRDPLEVSLRASAIAATAELAKVQSALYAQTPDSISRPFVVVLVLWLCFIFGSFAMSANANATLLGVLFFCALSAASAIYLIMELGQPFDGLMQLSSAQLRNALGPL